MRHAPDRQRDTSTAETPESKYSDILRTPFPPKKPNSKSIIAEWYIPCQPIFPHRVFHSPSPPTYARQARLKAERRQSAERPPNTPPLHHHQKTFLRRTSWYRNKKSENNARVNQSHSGVYFATIFLFLSFFHHSSPKHECVSFLITIISRHGYISFVRPLTRRPNRGRVS